MLTLFIIANYIIKGKCWPFFAKNEKNRAAYWANKTEHCVHEGTQCFC